MLERPRDRFEDPDLYANWDNEYYSSCFDKFYDAIVDLVVDHCNPSKKDRILDAGCGPGVHTLRFLKRGYKCRSIDFSETALEEARRRVKTAGYEGNTTFSREDLTNLTFPDETFSQIFCWGVIMHIPEPQKAISELSRVLKPGGWLALSSVNGNSLDKFLLQMVAYKLKRPKTLRQLGTTEMGRYAVFEERGKELFVQGLFIDKVKSLFKENNMAMSACIGTQPTELYTLLRSDVANRAISLLNVFWLKHVRIPVLCADHLYLAQKKV